MGDQSGLEKLGEEFCTAVTTKTKDKYKDIQKRLNILMKLIRNKKDSSNITKELEWIEKALMEKYESSPTIMKCAKNIRDFWDVYKGQKTGTTEKRTYQQTRQTTSQSDTDLKLKEAAIAQTKETSNSDAVDNVTNFFEQLVSALHDLLINNITDVSKVNLPSLPATSDKELENKLKDMHAKVEETTKLCMDKNRQMSASKQKMQEMANKIKEYEQKLSELASAKLTHDNPAIPDLSDPDRPTKLAEKYSSLYDNQWTDAIAELTKSNPAASEKVLTEQLLNMLTDGFNFCKDARNDQVTKLEQLIVDPAQSTKSSQSNSNQVNEIYTKHLRDAAKASSIVASENIFKAFVSDSKINKKYGNLMRLCGAYIEDCVRLCWLMQVQSPPVCIDLGIKEGQTFPRDTYREYTSSGKTIAFVVWPALFLHEKGPLLMKGVAQGKDVYFNF